MSPLRSLTLLLLLLALAVSASADGLVAELLALQSRSPSGVIHLDDSSISHFLSSAPTPRPYSLVVFFDAASFRDKPDLHLAELRSEFALVAAAFAARHAGTPSASKVFFCDLEFRESQSSFALFGVSSVPHVRHIGPHAGSLRDSDPMDQSGFARLAESMSEFVESKTDLPVGPIVRPPPITTKQIAFLLVALMILAPFLIKRIIAGETLLHDPRLWMGLAVFVYFFSVSGVMHNIIRKTPMFLSDPNKLVFFYQGSGMQLGAEGFAVGSLYTVVGLMMAFVTQVLVRMKSAAAQRGFMVVAMVVSFWAVNKVIYLDNWKTGYSIHTFWPSSWK